VLGGWLTEAYSWRYVFYINLPIGVLAFLGMTTFLPETAPNATAKLDWFGFGTLSLTIAALQVMLDRGEQLDWFGSGEIVTEAVIGVSVFYLFLVHTFTAQEPFVRPSLFRDRNFTAGVVFIAIVGLTYYASLARDPNFQSASRISCSPRRREPSWNRSRNGPRRKSPASTTPPPG
jgi:DHA2 family multidrug resistance protein